MRHHTQWKCRLLAVWMLLGAAEPAVAEDTDLSVLDAPVAIRALASGWLLLEQEAHNTRIRVYRLEEDKPKPCNPSEDDCHWERLAISIATTGERSVSRLYLSRPANVWMYPNIVRMVDARRPDVFSIITAEEYVPEKSKMEYEDQQMGRDSHRHRTFFVNLHGAHVCKD